MAKHCRGERIYDGPDDYDGRMIFNETDLKVFDCRTKVLEYIYNALHSEMNILEAWPDGYFTRHFTLEELGTYQSKCPIVYAVRLNGTEVVCEEYFKYVSYEVE
jgi:hypothetical protein